MQASPQRASWGRPEKGLSGAVSEKRMHRRRFLQLVGRLGAVMIVPGLEAVGQPSVSA
jgi:hypothetical protein